MIVSTFYDVLFVDINRKEEVDIDNLYKIGDIRSIVYTDKKFYILANKCERLLGYYLIAIDEKKPGDVTNPNMLINWKSKLDIADANLYQF